MKKILVLLLIWLLAFTWKAEAGMLNSYDDLKTFVNELSVKNGVFYDLEASTWQHVVSGSLYDYYKEGFSLASIDVGYMTQDTGLIIGNLNIPGINSLFWKIPMGELKPTIGLGAGYNFRSQNPCYGVAMFGVTWGF